MPFITLQVDHLAPASRSHSLKRSRCIFLIIDAFSKYIKLYATKCVRTSRKLLNVLSLISNIIAGRRVISDQDSFFASREFEELYAANMQPWTPN